MKKSEIQPGVEVYHNHIHSYGKGVIVGWKKWNILELTLLWAFTGRKPPQEIEVRFEGKDGLAICRPSDLVKKPNVKRMKDMIEHYRKMGRSARIENGRLITSEIHGGEQ